MRVRIEPSRLCGTVEAPPSKSDAHRHLIAACLAPGESRVEHVGDSDDVAATVRCLTSLGADIRMDGDTAYITGKYPFAGGCDLYPGESGSTLRFLLPLCMNGNEYRFVCAGRLPERPLGVYETVARVGGMTFVREGNVLTVAGKLTAGDYAFPGNVSSQFATGMLFALPLLGGTRESTLTLTGTVESKPYLDMTLSVLKSHGIRVDTGRDGTMFSIPSGQRYLAGSYRTEGDWSGASFFLGATAAGGSVTVTGLDNGSRQGDRVCVSYFETLKRGTPTLDVSDCPDIFPILCAVAALLHGAVFTGTARLADKESDRGTVMREELAKCGADIRVDKDRITVKSTALYAPREALCSHNDHRIAMALSILLCTLGGELTGAESVQKSFPAFFDRLRAVGGKVTVTE